MQDKGSAASKITTAAALEQGGPPERARLQAAMLEVSGEVGYRNASVRLVLERSGGHRAQFYGYFRDRADCFAAAHEAEIERLYGTLLAAAWRQPSPREGLRAALEALFGFVAERPLTARALLREVYVAAGPALANYEDVLERLSRAVDGACRGTVENRHAPPPIAASFMVGAIEEFVRAQLGRGDSRRLWAALPELMHLFVGPYFGDEAAREELRRPAQQHQ